MELKKLKSGDMLEVGDKIRMNSFIGTSWFPVSRVTPKFAFVKWNDVAEGKFQRMIDYLNCPVKSNSERFCTVQYSAWRPVNKNEGCN